MTQATTNGMFTAIMECFRPTGWVRVPDIKQPTGTQIKLILPATQFRGAKHSEIRSDCHSKGYRNITKGLLCET